MHPMRTDSAELPTTLPAVMLSVEVHIFIREPIPFLVIPVFAALRGAKIPPPEPPQRLMGFVLHMDKRVDGLAVERVCRADPFLVVKMGRISIPVRVHDDLTIALDRIERLSNHPSIDRMGSDKLHPAIGIPEGTRRQVGNVVHGTPIDGPVEDDLFLAEDPYVSDGA